MLAKQKEQLLGYLNQALKNIARARGFSKESLPSPHLERPKAIEHGDIACNIALQIAKPWKANPREIAQQMVLELTAQDGFQSLIASSEIAGPGFINFRLSNQAKTAVISEIAEERLHFGDQT